MSSVVIVVICVLDTVCTKCKLAPKRTRTHTDTHETHTEACVAAEWPALLAVEALSVMSNCVVSGLLLY